MLAACGIEALKSMTGRLHDDHERASRFARALSAIDGIQVSTFFLFFFLSVSTGPHAWRSRMYIAVCECLFFFSEKKGIFFYMR